MFRLYKRHISTRLHPLLSFSLKCSFQVCEYNEWSVYPDILNHPLYPFVFILAPTMFTVYVHTYKSSLVVPLCPVFTSTLDFFPLNGSYFRVNSLADELSVGGNHQLHGLQPQHVIFPLLLINPALLVVNLPLSCRSLHCVRVSHSYHTSVILSVLSSVLLSHLCPWTSFRYTNNTNHSSHLIFWFLNELPNHLVCLYVQIY